MRCVAPVHAEDTVNVEVSNNGVDFTSAGTYFQFVADAAVMAISPHSGPTSGGTSVLVHGYNFIDSKDLRCKFGHTSVLARWLSSTRLECVAPVHHNTTGDVAVHISLNGVDFTASSKNFTYAPAPEVTSIHPSVGPSSGGTRLTISGVHFTHTAYLMCRIGHTEVPASFVSSTELLCTTPILAIGSVDVAVSDNGLDFSAGVAFTSIADAALLAVAPALGPSTGGTTVTISGQGFRNESGLACLFDGAEAPWTRYVSETELVCQAPSHKSGTFKLKSFRMREMLLRALRVFRS